MKFLKGLLTVAVPIAAIAILFNIDPYYGVIGIACILLYSIYMRRGAFIFYAASKKAVKKDYAGAVKLIKFGYDKKMLTPYQEAAYAFLLLKRMGEAGEAKRITEKVLSRQKLSDQDRNFAKLNLSMIYFLNDETDKALELTKELYKEYKTTSLYGNYGYYLIAKGEYDEALRINLEAFDFNKNNHVILDNLGQTYLMTEQYEKAEEIYKNLIEQKPVFPEAYYNYALVKEHAGDLDEAIYQMKMALQKDFNYLSTIDAEDIGKEIERLYAARDKIKGGAGNE